MSSKSGRKPLAPRFVTKKAKAPPATGQRCALCPSVDASPRPLYRHALLCDTCSRNQTVGGVARVVLNAAGRFLFGIGDPPSLAPKEIASKVATAHAADWWKGSK